MLARTDFTPSTKVLDVGCGVATTAIEIAKRFGAHVTAVDISPLMLERAQASITAANVSNLMSVEHGDILKLAYPDDTFDVVIAEAVTMFVDRHQAATELARVTKPGGRALATEFFCGTHRHPRHARSSSARSARASPSTPSRTGSRSTNRPASPTSKP